MKTLLLSTALLLAALTAHAQTNKTIYPDAPLAAEKLGSDGKEFGNYELTLGGGGESVNHQSTIGLDISLSTNPLKARPEIWVGLAQGLYWEPVFAGSTDMFWDWAVPLWKDKLYANLGWSVGALYTAKTLDTWRTGPELTFEYYTKGNAFFFAGVNYDVWQSSSDRDNGFRYSFGVGVTW